MPDPDVGPSFGHLGGLLSTRLVRKKCSVRNPAGNCSLLNYYWEKQDPPLRVLKAPKLKNRGSKPMTRLN